MALQFNRRQAVAATLAAAVMPLRAQPAAGTFTAEQARRELRIVKRAFTDLHPGLYRYATPQALDAEFAAADAAVAGGSSRAGMFLLCSRLAAAVRCGHTWTNPSNQGPAVVEQLFGARDKLPLTLRWVQGRVLVTGSLDAAVPAGSELLAIDGRPVAEIAAALLPLQRADGSSELSASGKRRAQLDSGRNGGAMDRFFPLLFPPAGGAGGRYRLRLPDREAEVAAVTLAERDRTLPPPPDAWQFSIDGDTGVLTLPTFAFWNSRFDWRAFLDRSFDALDGVPFLVIDQRRNEGGDDAIGVELTRRLLRAPLVLPGAQVESAYERVPYVLARYLDTWNFDFFDRTGAVRKGPGRNWIVTAEADAPPRRIEPHARPYRGRTVALIGPENSSAGFLLARDLQAAGAATLLGRPSGGNLRGLNGGQLAWLTLPHSGVAIDIPLVAAFTPGPPPDRGVLPDIAAEPSFADARAGIDTEMQAARRWVAERR